MKKYVHVIDDLVIEPAVELPDGFTVDAIYSDPQNWVDVTEQDPTPGEGWTVKGGTFKAPPQPTESEASVIARLTRTVEVWLNEQAQALGYDNTATAVSYADEPAVPKFQAEGQALRAQRSLAWAKCYEILSDVQAGKRGIPTDAELIAELPQLELSA